MCVFVLKFVVVDDKLKKKTKKYTIVRKIRKTLWTITIQK